MEIGGFALQGVDLSVDAGECCVVLGPNGAGKSVLLETLAGFYSPRVGRICVEGRDVSHVAPEHRDIALLFQDFTLFPHLTVAQNIAFGLGRRARSGRSLRCLDDLLHRFGLSHLRDRSPQYLSGGEKQKVALARAMAVEPRVFLFDEPASALDAATRTELQESLKQFLKEAHVPAAYVTHDHLEARALADRLLVLDQGRVMQSGDSETVFNRPANPFVAEFVGVETLVEGRVLGVNDDRIRLQVGSAQLQARSLTPSWARRRVLAAVRAENVRLADQPGVSAVNNLPATIVRVIDRGPYLKVLLNAGFPLTAYLMKHSACVLDLRPGARLFAIIAPDRVHLIGD